MEVENLPGNMTSLFFKAEDIYMAAGREPIYPNSYLPGSRSRAKSALYTAAGCQHKIVIYTAAVQEKIGYIHCCRVSA